MKRIYALVVIAIMVSGFMYSCKNDDSVQGSSTLFSLYLTDAPAAYDAVNIEIVGVEVHTDEDGWVTYDVITPGIYNLLEYASGVDTMLISEDMPSGILSQIRLILGANNTIVVDGISHPLETPSAEQSGLKINVNAELEPGIAYAMWLDFDVEKSIVEKGNGDYSLKPVLRAYTEATSGAISGSIIPVDGAYYVFATNGIDSIGTYITGSGTFLITGLPADTYDVHFNPNPGFIETSVPDVSVTVGEIEDIGSIAIPF